MKGLLLLLKLGICLLQKDFHLLLIAEAVELSRSHLQVVLNHANDVVAVQFNVFDHLVD